MIKRKLRSSVGFTPIIFAAADFAFELRTLLPLTAAAFAACGRAKRTLQPSDSVFAICACKVSLSHFFSFVLRLVLVRRAVLVANITAHRAMPGTDLGFEGAHLLLLQFSSLK